MHGAKSEIFTPERCWILECWNVPGDPVVSIARARVARGITTRRHRLKNVVERYLVIEGSGVVRVGEQAPTSVGPGDVVSIPAGTAQQITNNGDTDLIFYCICSPRFTPDCYEALE